MPKSSSPPLSCHGVTEKIKKCSCFAALHSCAKWYSTQIPTKILKSHSYKLHLLFTMVAIWQFTLATAKSRNVAVMPKILPICRDCYGMLFRVAFWWLFAQRNQRIANHQVSLTANPADRCDQTILVEPEHEHIVTLSRTQKPVRACAVGRGKHTCALECALED